jgi:cytochrome c
MLKWVLAIGMIAAMPVVASAADAEAGATVFNKCKACHQLGKNAVGPNLVGVVGRKSGASEGFTYSDAMKAAGLTWDEATLKEYLTNPKAKIPGNKMVFMGLADAADLDNVIEYLKTAK